MQTSLMGFLCMAGVAGIGAILGFKMSKNDAEVSAVKGAFVALCGCIVLFYVVVVGFSQRGLSLFFAIATLVLPLLVFYALARRDYGVDSHHTSAKLLHDIRKGKPISDALVRQHTLSFKTEEEPNQSGSQKEAPVCMVDEVLEVVQLDIEKTSEEPSKEERGAVLTSEPEELFEDTLNEEQTDSHVVEAPSTEQLHMSVDETEAFVEEELEFDSEKTSYLQKIQKMQRLKELAEEAIEEPPLTEESSEVEEAEAGSEVDYSDAIEQDSFELEEVRDLIDEPLKAQTNDEPVPYEMVSFEDDEAGLEEPVLSQRITVSAEEDLDIDEIEDIEEPVFIQEESPMVSEFAAEAAAESNDAETSASVSESKSEELEVAADLSADSESKDVLAKEADFQEDDSLSAEPEVCEPEESVVSSSPTSFNPQSYFDRATALRDNGQYVVAALLYRECLEKAVDYKTVNKAALEEIACYVKAGKVQKAAELAEVFLKTARKLTPAEKIKAEAVLRAGTHHE